MQKTTKNIIITAIIACICGVLIGCIIWNTSGEKLAKLPLPTLSEGQRGKLGIDKNINEDTIDKYLNRSDSVYRDMRMFEDPAQYENIDGDRYLSGYVKGFELTPFPLITNVKDLPEEVGNTYDGITLFTQLENGEYSANFRESMQILVDLFPRDKNIFLMCGGGGYAGMMKNMLVKLGWDKNKIYVVGGYWYYEGKNKVEIKDQNKNGDTYYAFWKVPYHQFDFDRLTKLD